MLNKIIQKIRAYPGLFVLICMLLLINLVSLKPDLHIVGWDNYSSYFQPAINIPRTLFATWREYRGFGVPSDSESPDIFRQLYSLAARTILPETLLDQVYMLLSFDIGIIAMYVFSRMLIKKYFLKEQTTVTIDIFGFLSAMFYLFNLNTLATFYFPMIMYVNRFYSIPLIGIIFMRLLSNQKISKREVFLLGQFRFILSSCTGLYLESKCRSSLKYLPLLTSLTKF